MSYFVQIKRYEDDAIEHEIPCNSERKAIRVANGLDINLDHEKYYTEVVEKD